MRGRRRRWPPSLDAAIHVRNSAGPCKLGGKEITIQNGEGLCVTASGHKNGAKILAKKCKDGSSTQQWQIGPM